LWIATICPKTRQPSYAQDGTLSTAGPEGSGETFMAARDGRRL
jgi:hypothetical protein